MLADRIVFICTIVVACVYLYATTSIPSLEIGDPLGPRAFPYLIGVALLCAGGVLGYELWRDRKIPVPENEPPKFEPKVVAVLAVVSVWTGLYYLVFDDLGYVVATTTFLLPLTAYFHPGRWVANILSSALFAGFTYWLFKTLDVNLPQGVLPF